MTKLTDYINSALPAGAIQIVVGYKDKVYGVAISPEIIEDQGVEKAVAMAMKRLVEAMEKYDVKKD